METKCYIISGPNGAGKTTFANEFLLERSWANFNEKYKSLADSWIVFDTSGKEPVILDVSEEKQ